MTGIVRGDEAEGQSPFNKVCRGVTACASILWRIAQRSKAISTVSRSTTKDPKPQPIHIYRQLRPSLAYTLPTCPSHHQQHSRWLLIRGGVYKVRRVSGLGEYPKEMHSDCAEGGLLGGIAGSLATFPMLVAQPSNDVILHHSTYAVDGYSWRFLRRPNLVSP